MTPFFTIARVSGAILAAGALIALSACTDGGAGNAIGTQVLTDAGVAPAKASVIVADTAMAGQLFCQWGPTLLAVSNVKVTGATSATVAAACRAAYVPGTPAPIIAPIPVAAPVGSVAVVASVPASVSAAVAASVTQ